MKTTAKIITIGAASAGAVLAFSYLFRKRPLYNLFGKVILITGGSRGLGLNLARQLLAENAKVVICARNKEELERAFNELSEIGEVVAVECDVTDKAQVDRMVDEIEKRLGPVDVLINNAGIIQVGPFENMTIQDFEDAMKIHFWAPLYTTMAVMESMKKKKEGRIVNISSIGGQVTVPHLLPYTASKFALTGFSEGLREELKKYNIRVTTIYPGLMRTGSPHNITVKGQHEKEYAAFSITGSLPLLTMSAEFAARHTIKALKEGDSSKVIFLPYKMLASLYKAFPGLTSDLFAFVNQLLPNPTETKEGKKGHESYSKLSPSILTVMTEKAAVENNELGFS